MNLLLRLRRFLAKCVLRGRLLDWWLLRRGRQIDAAYRKSLIGEMAGGNVEVSNPISGRGDQLRQILVIADCMWEQNDLVPELARVADTRLLDLHPGLRNMNESPEARAVVCDAVRRYAKADTSLAPDVILFYLRPGLLSEEVFALLRSLWKCPLLGMNLDDRVEFFPSRIFSAGNQNYLHWARHFDLNITNCLPATDWYRARNLPCVYSPQGVHHTSDLTLPTSADFKYTLSFLGQVKVERRMIVDRICSAGIPIHLFGRGWPNSQWVDNPNTVFRGSQINLGIGFASPSLTLTTVKGRDFECPGVGACYLTSYSWELPLHYELGKEILCYRSVEELIEMYSWYHKRPNECLKIAQAAWRRSVAEHTWEKRFRKIFQDYGFKLPTNATGAG